MYRAYIENEKKEKIELTNSVHWIVDYIDGLLPEEAEINTTTVTNADGSIDNSKRINERTISIGISPLFPIEENRQRLYQFFRVKKKVVLYFKNKNRDVKIEGIVKSYDGSLFEQSQQIEINILCTDPYFKQSAETQENMSQILSMFEFPFSIEKEGIEFSQIQKIISQNIYNAGDTETGLIIELSAMGTVENPTIYNVDTRAYFGLNFTMQYGDVIRINTTAFNKKVELIRNGQTSNIINSIMKGNTWFKLNAGDNLLTYSCDSGEENLSIKFIYSNMYEGV